MYICVPITAVDMDGALKDIAEIGAKADLIELRIDFMPEPDLPALLEACQVPAIVTNRVADEGGHFKGSEEERIAYLRQAIELGAAYVDIELRQYVELDKKDTKVIVSYHDFEKTPEDIADTCQKMLATNADILKFALMAKNQADVDRVVAMLEGSDRDMIAISMGALGQSTRVHPKNYLTFAALSAEKASGPGQFTVDQIRQAMERGGKL